MDFELKSTHKMLQRVVREFALESVAPIAAEIDLTERYPMENVKKMAEMGLMGIPIPKQYGGSGGDELGYAMTVEELSKHCASTGVILSAHTSLGAWPILAFGTEEQKQKFLRPLASGEKIGAFALTEAGAGTDASSQQTVAVSDGDTYVLNGSKIFITGAGQADTYIVFAMTDRKLGVKGISTFIVEKGTPGFSFGKMEDKMGIRASSTGELVFEDCRIPKENLLGREGKGFSIAMKTLDGGRIGIASQALGIAQGAMDECVKYMSERKQFGKSISKFQGLQWYIAEMETKVEAARLLVYRAASCKAKGLPYSKEAAMAKLFAAEAAMEVTTKAVQIFGGYGYTKDYPMERMMRDAKITEIYEGTSEVQKMVIASHVLGK